MAQAQEVNLYTSRHYQTDEALYNGFTQATGIKINRVEADDAGITARLRAEGWRTLRALSEDEDPKALGCTHRLTGDAPTAL